MMSKNLLKEMKNILSDETMPSQHWFIVGVKVSELKGIAVLFQYLTYPLIDS